MNGKGRSVHFVNLLLTSCDITLMVPINHKTVSVVAIGL